jgi:hypothetical protein
MLANNLGNKVTSREIDWGEKCRRAWGPEWGAPDHGVYEFSNGRKFDSTDRGLTGIYGISGTNFLMVGDGQYPDMPSNVHMLQENLYKIELE